MSIKIVFCFDENLIAQVQVAAASLLDACGAGEHFEIHCVCTRAAGSVEAALGQVIRRRNPESSLVMHCVENPYAGAYQVRDISAGTYLRLALPRLLPDVDKILYMDVDVLVRGSLSPLWETSTEGIGLAAGAHMYVVAGAATLLTLFGLEALTLFFGGLGRKRTLIVYSSGRREVIDAMFNKLKTSKYTVISYEIEPTRMDGATVYRATLVIRAKGIAEEEEFVNLLRESQDITVERIV